MTAWRKDTVPTELKRRRRWQEGLPSMLPKCCLLAMCSIQWEVLTVWISESFGNTWMRRQTVLETASQPFHIWLKEWPWQQLGTVVKKFSKRWRSASPSGLFAVQSIQRLINEDANGVKDVDPNWSRLQQLRKNASITKGKRNVGTHSFQKWMIIKCHQITCNDEEETN